MSNAGGVAKVRATGIKSRASERVNWAVAQQDLESRGWRHSKGRERPVRHSYQHTKLSVFVTLRRSVGSQLAQWDLHLSHLKTLIKTKNHEFQSQIWHFLYDLSKLLTLLRSFFFFSVRRSWGPDLVVYTIIPELQGSRHEDPKIKDSLSCGGRPCLKNKAQDLVTVSVKSVPKLSNTRHTTRKQRTLGLGGNWTLCPACRLARVRRGHHGLQTL